MAVLAATGEHSGKPVLFPRWQELVNFVSVEWLR